MELGPELLQLWPLMVSLLILIAAPQIYKLYKKFWWTPRRIRRVFEAQRIPCLPSKSIIYGNAAEFFSLVKQATSEPMAEVSHKIVPRVIPHYCECSRKYGDRFVFWMGPRARFQLTDPYDAKIILSTKFGYFKKPPTIPAIRDLFGNGLVSLQGEKWAQHRRIMNPAFYQDKLKAMIPTMAECTTRMFEKWSMYIENVQEIDVQKEFNNLTADIISHTAFGSSFKEGKQVFELQTEQQLIAFKSLRSVSIPGANFLPTPFNIRRWKIKRNIDSILRNMIEQRLQNMKISQDDSDEKDLLGLMMAANMGMLKGNQKNLCMGIDEIKSECKVFFFAGHETTATLLTWACLLLATNPEWQERTREEVLAKCGKGDVPSESLNLKILGMVLYETLRLYPPAVILSRTPERDTKLGDLLIPAETEVMLPILWWHHNPEYWGEDADEFKPERFADGVAKANAMAKGAFMPFSIGPRICIGQAFALQEAKVVMCMILQHYRMVLSTSYKHAPGTVLTLQPQFGMPIIFHKL